MVLNMYEQEVLTRLEQLSEEISTLKDIVTNNDQERWFSLVTSYYFFIDSEGRIKKDTYNGDALDHGRLDIGNYYKTEEEAKSIVEQLKLKQTLKTNANYVMYDYKGRKILL